MAVASGHFELTTFRPVPIPIPLQSVTLLGDACRSLADRCPVGLEPVPERLAELVDLSLMPVTAPNPTSAPRLRP